MPGSTLQSQGGSVRASRDPRWSRTRLLELGAAHRAPEAPGIVLLIPNPKSWPRRVWAGATVNIQERLDHMLRTPEDDPALEQLLEPYPRNVSFRYLVVRDPERREAVLRAISASAPPSAMPSGPL